MQRLITICVMGLLALTTVAQIPNYKPSWTMSVDNVAFSEARMVYSKVIVNALNGISIGNVTLPNELGQLDNNWFSIKYINWEDIELEFDEVNNQLIATASNVQAIWHTGSFTVKKNFLLKASGEIDVSVYNATVTAGVKMNYVNATADPENRKLNSLDPVACAISLDPSTAHLDIEGSALA